MYFLFLLSFSFIGVWGEFSFSVFCFFVRGIFFFLFSFFRLVGRFVGRSVGRCFRKCAHNLLKQNRLQRFLLGRFVGRLLGRFHFSHLRKRLYLLGFSLGRLLVACLVGTIPKEKPTPWPCPHQYPCISRKPCCLPHGRSTYQPSSGLSPACTDCL